MRSPNLAHKRSRVNVAENSPTYEKLYRYKLRVERKMKTRLTWPQVFERLLSRVGKKV